jgi:hypothetical protein
MKSKLLRLLGTGMILLVLGTARSVGQTLQISPDAVRSEENVSIDGWVAHLDQSAEYVEKTLGTYIKMLSGNKADKRTKNLWVASKVKFEEISPLRGDLRASLTAEGNGTAVGFTFSPGYDIHVDKTAYPQEYEKMAGFVKKYVKHHYTEFYREEAAKAEKELNKRRREVEKNEKRIARLQQTTTKNEQKISEGDSKATKLTERNSKNTAETDGRTQENEKLQGEVQHYQEMLSQFNAALQKVRDF